MSGGFDVMQFAPIIFLFIVFYFLLIRPQQKKMKEHQAMISGIRRGDRVVTNGGIIGTVVKIVDDQEVQLEIDEGVRVRVLRSMISNLMSKSEPANAVVTEIAQRKEKDAGETKKKPLKKKASGK
jgi:preprotein translocase subunit YajC